MKSEPVKELKNSINQLSSQLDQLKSKLTNCEESNRTYNRLLIERACLRKRLREIESKNILSFLGKIDSKNRQKRICDYFGS